jgi:hypothetical protein
VGWYDGAGRRLLLESPDAGQDYYEVAARE